MKTKVNHSIWEEAQEYERKFWLNDQKKKTKFLKNQIWNLLSFLKLVPKYRGDDWNIWWKGKFDDYLFLPPYIENAIEIGCGPYTNIRLILQRCCIKYVFLNDPLMEIYSSFKKTIHTTSPFNASFISDNHPFEKNPFKNNYFDLVVMINVLDHVQDATICMQEAIHITKPGGIFIFGQDLTDDEDEKYIQNLEGDIGHPIKLNHEWIDSFLGDNFNILLKKILPRNHGRNPEAHYGTYLFAGIKI